MRRWNGWGDDTIPYPLPANAPAFLEERLGPGAPPRDATFAAVVATVPPGRLPAHPLIRPTECATPAARACPTGWPCAAGR